MNGNLIKLGLFGAVAYYLYEYYKPLPVDPKQVANTGLPNNPINNIAVIQPPNELKTKLAITAGKVDGLNWYEWNYYYNQLTGQNVNLPPSINAQSVVSLNDFWNEIVPKGLSGTGITANYYESELATMRYM